VDAGIRSRRARTLTASAAIAVLALGSIGVGTVAGARPEPPSLTVGRAAQARALDFWTPSRMREAKAAPMPRKAGAPIEGGLARPDGTAKATKGAAPRGAAIDRAMSTDAQPDPAVGYPYPYPFARYFVDQALYPGTYPYITVGKLFFQQRGVDGVLRNYVCSGASSAAGNVVFTAGHCLSTGRSTWSTNVIFVPSYENGAEPYGRFACTFMTVGASWHSSRQFARDVGACRVGVSNLFPFRTLTQSVGWLGFAWNQSRYQHWHAMGYPQQAPFNGQLMTVCTASWATTDLNASISSPDPNGIGCDMTKGSSGGPWVRLFKGANHINGLNSYKYGTRPLAMYSPYFDTYVNRIRCYAATGVWPPPAC
jgi:V8-like Glu-specific endopeptidase